MDNILNSITGREKYLIRGNNVLNAITGTVFGVIEDGVVKSPTTGKTVALLTEGGGSGSVDLSFITAESGDILKGKVGADRNGNPVHGTLVPDSGGSGSGEMQFYLCTGYDGVVEKIIITAGAIYDDMEGMSFSLVGEYNIVDPGAVGTARKWYCAQTTANGEYEPYNYGVTIGCVEIYVDWDPELGDIYEKRWAIGSGKDVYEDGCWLISPAANIESPFDVVSWGNNWGNAVVTPALTSDVADAAPYGPTGWKGRPIVMTDKPVLFSYGAGLKNVNGFWEQTVGEGITLKSQWQLIGTDYVLRDGNPDYEYHYWHIYGTYPEGDYYGSMFNQTGENWREEDIKPPSAFGWQSGSSNWNPPPTIVYSENGGYFPAKNVVSGLKYTGKLPKLREFWNDGATIKAERFFPA